MFTGQRASSLVAITIGVALTAALLIVAPGRATASSLPSVGIVTVSRATVSLSQRASTTVTVTVGLTTSSGVSGSVPVRIVDSGSATRFAPALATLISGTDVNGVWRAKIQLAAYMHGTHALTISLCPVDCNVNGTLRLPLVKTVTVKGSDWPTLTRIAQQPRRLPAGATSGAIAAGRVVFAKSRQPVRGIDVLFARNGGATPTVVGRTNRRGQFDVRWPWPRTTHTASMISFAQSSVPGAAFDRTALRYPATRARVSHKVSQTVLSVGRPLAVTGSVWPVVPGSATNRVVLEERVGSRWVRRDSDRLRIVKTAAGIPTKRATYRLTTRFSTVGGHALRVRKAGSLCAAGPCRIAGGQSNSIGVVAGNKVYWVERQLHRLGVPVGATDGALDERDRQALCAWRDMSGQRASRGGLTNGLVSSIMGRHSLPRANRPDGLYVNKTCQMLFQVVGGKFRRVVWASTGKPGFETPNGTGAIFRKIEGPVESTFYPGAFMYNPMFFFPARPAIALHGSATNDLVLPYPASHGCIRVWRPQIHKIFKESPIGTLVKVYGRY